jgi:hypothetical protein
VFRYLAAERQDLLRAGEMESGSFDVEMPSTSVELLWSSTAMAMMVALGLSAAHMDVPVCLVLCFPSSYKHSPKIFLSFFSLYISPL